MSHQFKSLVFVVSVVTVLLLSGCSTMGQVQGSEKLGIRLSYDALVGFTIRPLEVRKTDDGLRLAARIRRMGGRSRVRRSHLDVQLISADGIILDEKSIRLPSRFLRRYRTVYVDFDAVSSVGSTIKIVQRRGSSCSGEQNSAKSTTSSC